MSERMWSVFFSRKSCGGVIQYRSYKKPSRGTNEVKNNLHDPYLYLIFHFTSKVLDDEGWLHDRGGDKVFIPLVLLLKFG